MKKISLLLILFIFHFSIMAGPIHDAAQEGNLDAVKTLLNENRSLIEDKTEDGNTPLLVAASSGHLELLQYLIGEGADLMARTNRGSTALNLASYNGHLSVVKYMISLDFDKNVTNNGGFTPLMHAVLQNHSDIAQYLIENGADLYKSDPTYGGTAFHWAANRSNASMMELLFASGLSYDIKSSTDGSTPIFWAANAGNLDALNWLIGKGANINEANENGWTPLFTAVQRGNMECVGFLIENGADLKSSNSNGTTILHAAIVGEQPEMIDYILNQGIDINIQDESGTTALHLASIIGNAELVSYLISKGANVNLFDNQNNSPVCNASRIENPEILKMLVENGADINVVSSNGQTPLQNAINIGQDSLVDFMLEKGADFNFRDNINNRTPLHLSAIKGYLNICQNLINYGADPNVVDSAGHTPLYYASKYGHKKVAKLLVGKGGREDKIENNFGKSKFLVEELGEGEAYMWYLGHCGWALKTRDNLLIFDCFNNGSDPSEPLLANGHINPEEINGQNVTVFVTHDHSDHFDTSIFNWRNSITNIQYIYGFRPEQSQNFRTDGYHGPEFEYIGPREHKTINNIDITTIESNDGGVGYFLNVDGLEIYFAGDHAGWREGDREGFTREIDYLLDYSKNLDLAFLNVTGCHIQDTIALEESILYTLAKLTPQNWVPTHGLDREEVYVHFADKIKSKNPSVQALCPQNKGDWFYYKKNEI